MAEPDGSRNGEGTRRILEERARALARPLESEATEETFQLVVLVLGSERYGVDIRKVRETQPLESLAPIPHTPPFWAGVVNIRGTLHPALDLGRFLGVGEENDGNPSKKLVLVSGVDLTVGLVVDDAPAVHRVHEEEIGPPLFAGGESAQRVVSGMTRDRLAVLDIDALLADPRLAVREE